MGRRTSALPVALPPIGLNREQAAEYVGISASLFDRLITDGLLPAPRALGGRFVWDVAELTTAFRNIPHRAAETASQSQSERSAWD